MIFDASSLGKKRDGCRDAKGEFVPVAQCNPRRGLSGGVGYFPRRPGMRAYQAEGRTPCVYPEIPRRKYRNRFFGSLGEDASIPDPLSYQDIWAFLWDSCKGIAGEDSCRRLLGHTPFVCPVDEPKKGSFITPLIIGVVIGKIIL